MLNLLRERKNTSVFKEDGRIFHTSTATKERDCFPIFVRPYFRFMKVSLRRVSGVVTANITSILKHVTKNVRNETLSNQSSCEEKLKVFSNLVDMA